MVEIIGKREVVLTVSVCDEQPDYVVVNGVKYVKEEFGRVEQPDVESGDRSDEAPKREVTELGYEYTLDWLEKEVLNAGWMLQSAGSHGDFENLYIEVLDIVKARNPKTSRMSSQ